MREWSVTVNDTAHTVVFEGCRLNGRAKIRIDGKLGVYDPIFVRKIGMFYPFGIENAGFLLRLDLRNRPVGLIQDGVYLGSGAHLEEELIERIQTARQAQRIAGERNRLAMGSFLSLVVLTYVNLFLIAVDASVSFPFSAFVPQLIISLGMYVYGYSTGIMVAFGAISVLLASVYLLLYLLAKRRIWPIMTALVLMVIDTGVLLYFAVGDISSFLIDIAFHAWVLWSLYRILRVHLEDRKEARPPKENEGEF